LLRSLDPKRDGHRRRLQHFTLNEWFAPGLATFSQYGADASLPSATTAICGSGSKLASFLQAFTPSYRRDARTRIDK